MLSEVTVRGFGDELVKIAATYLPSQGYGPPSIRGMGDYKTQQVRQLMLHKGAIKPSDNIVLRRGLGRGNWDIVKTALGRR